eukprot:369233_1
MMSSNDKQLRLCIEPLVDLSDDMIEQHPALTHKLDGICAMCIRDSNDELVYELFIDHETQTIFEALIGGFDGVKLDASHTIQYQFVDIKYTLFSKQLHDQTILFLMFGDDESIVDSCDVCDCISHLVVSLYEWLKLPHQIAQMNNTRTMDEAQMSLHAMIEILNEIFCESSEEDMELDELQFILCMQLRLGMQTK